MEFNEMLLKEKETTCVGCGGYIKQDEFAYEQKICWNCYRKGLVDILGTQIASGRFEKAKLLLHSIVMAEEAFGPSNKKGE